MSIYFRLTEDHETYQVINQQFYLSIYPSIYFRLSEDHETYQLTVLYDLSTYLYNYLYTIYLYIYLLIYLSIYLFIYFRLSEDHETYQPTVLYKRTKHHKVEKKIFGLRWAIRKIWEFIKKNEEGLLKRSHLKNQIP